MNFPRKALILAMVLTFLHLIEAVDEGVRNPNSDSRRLEMFLRRIFQSQARTIINTLKGKEEAPDIVLTKIIKDPRIYFCRCKKILTVNDPLAHCLHKIDNQKIEDKDHRYWENRTILIS